MRLLLLSNSTNPGEDYLAYSKDTIASFLGDENRNIIFIPYAAVTFSYEEYVNKVNAGLEFTGISVKGIHSFYDPYKAIEEADAIIVGGGNTWKLTSMLQSYNLIDIIRKRVKKGIPYIGWSAGSNVACPTLRTTNDMPIIEPESFDTLNLIPFQLNPHYLDDHPSNHGGETREMRINEFILQNPTVPVVGLREGTMLRLDDNELTLIGKRSARIFKFGYAPQELDSDASFNFLLSH